MILHLKCNHTSAQINTQMPNTTFSLHKKYEEPP